MERIVLVIFIALVSSIAIAGDRIISVNGSGTIETAPDIIRINYSIFNVQKSDVAKAKAVVDKISAESVKALIALGIKEDDVTSSSLSIETAEDYDDNDNPIILGQVVKRDIDVVIRDITIYSAVIQALVDNKVSEIGSVKPDVSNYEQLKQDALALAAKDAQKNAEYLAKQFGARLDRVHQIGRQNVTRQFSLEEVIVTGMKAKSSNTKSATYEFQPGNVKVSSDVYVEFELK